MFQQNKFSCCNCQRRALAKRYVEAGCHGGTYFRERRRGERREKFLNFGGIPHYIFGDDKGSYEDTRESKIISCSPDPFLRSLRNRMKNEDSHMTFHMKSKKKQ